MAEFNASLVRERIAFIDDAIAVGDAKAGVAAQTVVRSNRILLELGQVEGSEKIVIRAQTVPATLRLASRVMFSFYKNGLFGKRGEDYDWESQWQSVLTEYDRAFMPDLWGAVYIEGRPVFKTLHSPFVDVIEKCALLNADNYDMTMNVAENALRQVGHAKRVDHASLVASIFSDSGSVMRCGVINRTGGRNTVFSFVSAGGAQPQRVVQTLSVAAAYLEAINLRRIIRHVQSRIERGEISRTSPEGRRMRVAMAQQAVNNHLVNAYEDTYKVRYRPEKPDVFSAAADTGDA